MPTVKLVPSAYTRSSTNRVAVTNPEYMYYDTSHTSQYAQIRGRNSSSSGPYYCFIHGFNFNSIPSDAEVTSFSIKIKCYKNSYLATGSSYRLRLASTPASSSEISSTSLSSDITTTTGGTVYTFPIPTSLNWYTLASYGSDFSIEIPLMSTSNSYPYLYVYGAEIEVNYVIPVYHTITASSEVSNITIEPATQSVVEENNATLSILSSTEAFTVTDNGVDVTNQLVQLQPTATETVIASSYTNLSSGITINSSYPITNAYDDADDTSNYARLDFSTSITGYIEFLFNIPSLPSGATLTSLSARARLRISSTSRMTNRICQLYSGSTAKGSNSDFSSTTSGGALITLTTGSWSISELSNLRMRIGATSSSSTSSKYLYVYGLDITINYELDGFAYSYTITNVMADHTVLVSGAATAKLYIKRNNSWIEYSKAYKKVNGVWVEQTALSTVFNNSTNYVDGGSV